MGTRIHVYLTHDFPDNHDVDAVLSRLGPSTEALRRVSEYWASVESEVQHLDCWQAGMFAPRSPLKRVYDGPGSIWLAVTPSAARIYTGGRWRGFLSIEPLRAVHLAAFRAIANACHSSSMAIAASSEEVAYETFLAGGTQADCIKSLQSEFGPPQPSIEDIQSILDETEHGVPNVWYLEQLS